MAGVMQKWVILCNERIVVLKGASPEPAQKKEAKK